MTYLIPAHGVDDGQNRTIMMMYLIPAPTRVPHDVDDGGEAGNACVSGVVSLLHEVVVFPAYLHRCRLRHAKYQLRTVGESGLCDSICLNWGMLERVDCVTVSASTGVCWREWIV